ncbi:cell wall protein [Streptomyces alfalfae]
MHAQSVEHTTSRRSGPRRWLRAVAWLIAAGLHGRANATTLRVAEDLAARMDYDLGHVRYCLDDTVARTSISKASVKRHVAYLRELGALAWVVHGTRANIRRTLGLGGYAATATVYAAVIPPVYDHALGHTIIGTGYEARIVIDQRGQTPKPVDNPPVDNSGSETHEPPSRTWVKEESQVKVVGGFNNTPRKRASRRTARLPHQKTSNNSQGQDGHARRSPLQVAREIRETQLVRAMVNWTQGERIRRLAFVLRPFFDRGLTAPEIAAELHGLCLRGRPKQPANFIHARLAQQAARDAELAAEQAAQEAAVAPQDNAAWQALAEQQAALADLFAAPARTDDDRRHARLYAWDHWEEIADHYDEDPDDALDLYGTKLCSWAVGKAARAQEAYDRV